MSALFPAYRATWETDQHRELRKHAAEFLRKESTPNQERWAKNHQVDREFWNKLGDARRGRAGDRHDRTWDRL